MSNQYSGGLITKTPTTPNSISAPGVWTLSQQAAAQATNTWPFPRDPQFKNVTMLLQGNGSAGAANSGAGSSSSMISFNADASTNNFNVAINGDARSDTFTPYRGNGYYGSLLSTNGNYFTSGTSAALGLSTGDWTIEFFVNINQFVDNQYLIDFRPSGSGGATQPLLWLTTGGALIYYTAGGVRITTSNSVVSLGTWTHIALCRASGTTRILVNGASVGSFTDSYDYGSSARFVNGTYGDSPGATNNNGGVISGYISNLRILKGTGLYTGTYTVPTAPLTAITNTSCLTHQSNRFIDNSGNSIAITPTGSPSVSPAQPFTLPSSVATYGSGYFDGTTDYLTAPNDTAFDMANGDFTVELWFNPTQAKNTSLFTKRASNASYSPIMVQWTSGNQLIAYCSTNGSSWGMASTTSATYPLNSWIHVAFVRYNNNLYLYVNGVSAVTPVAISAAVMTNSSAFVVGADDAAGSLGYAGYISNLRVVKGTAIFTSAFTPPTSPLTAVSGTSLLTTQYNGGGNNSGFKDSSQFNFPITRSGNATQGTFTPYESNWSNYFNGSDAYWKQASSTNYTFGTGDFTIECWINLNSTSTNMRRILGVGYGANGGSHGCTWDFRYQGTEASGQLSISRYDGSTDTTITSSGATIVAGQWHHIAVSRTGGNLRIFVDGVAYYNAANSMDFSSVTYGSNTEFWAGLGYYGPAGGLGGPRYFGGYISNIRIIKGTGIYSSNFTPSLTPLTAITNTQLLSAQSNRFLDNSVNAQAITTGGSPSVQSFSPFAINTVYNPATIGGSAYFDGSGDYLTAPSNAAFSFGTGDYTWEAWIYKTTSVRVNLMAISGGQGLAIAVNTSGNVEVCRAGTAIDYTFTAGIVNNAWTHIAVTRSGTNLRAFKDGVLLGTQTSSNNYGQGICYVAIDTGGSGDTFAGYMSNLHLIKGTCLYTTTFTPPTAPLTPITNTSLLLSYTNPAILDNAMMNNLETVGNAAVSTSVKKYGAASMYFDGTDDRLNMASSPNLAFGSGDFTLEMWAYFTSTSGSPTLTDSRSSTGSTAGFNLGLSTAKLQLYTTSQLLIGSSTLSANTWYHIAITRASGTLKIWLNGVQDATVANSTNWSDTTFVVGATPSAVNFMSGYIDDLRLTKGVCRYTATFTPPDQAFQLG